MAYKSGFLVESKVPRLVNLQRGDLLKDLEQFTEFWLSLRTRLMPGCQGQGPELCFSPLWCGVRCHSGCACSRPCPWSYRKSDVAALEPLMQTVLQGLPQYSPSSTKSSFLPWEEMSAFICVTISSILEYTFSSSIIIKSNNNHVEVYSQRRWS